MTENQRLKELQKLLNFKSQAEFATALGIKQGSLSDIYREKKGIGVSDSIKMKLHKDYSINIEWLETGVGEPKITIQDNQNSDNNVNNNMNGNFKGNVTITHNDFTKMVELQKENQEIQIQLNERLKTCQEQLSVSQKQINSLIDIINKKL